ncbi:MAG: methylenetetrahydrofolate reductase [NAD(P)H] [Deltaproteobacteria bacterium]|nr:methylenetetrahydrofolate reductase [NAD(P)H] [Deltaproteobacteria bacterium]
MKIKEILQKGFSLSFEVFPPARDGNIDALFVAIEELQVLRPDFISVTYGAGGGNKEQTIAIAARIKQHCPCEALAHLTCVGSNSAAIASIIDALVAEGIENILALRGDPPRGEASFQPLAGGFHFARELVAFIRSRGDFCVGVAGYPEKHPEASSIGADIAHLQQKVMAGADFITTQMFFDNDVFWRFMDSVRKVGVSVPILPGIFPVLNYKQVAKIDALSQAKIPRVLLEKIMALRDKPEETEKYGIEFAVRQAEQLISGKVDGIHFYTMNKSAAAIQIVRDIGLYR